MLTSFAKCLKVEPEEDQMLLFDMNHVILSNKKKCRVGPSQVPSPFSPELQPFCQEALVTLEVTPFRYSLPQAHLSLYRAQ